MGALGKRCVHHLFEAQVERTPDAVAVIFEEMQLTYAELNTRANQLAYRLQSLGIGAESRVGLYIERSLEMVVGLLAILKAGGAYVPLDPLMPLTRLQLMIEDMQGDVIVTQTHLLSHLSEVEKQFICLDKQSDSQPDFQSILQREMSAPKK